MVQKNVVRFASDAFANEASRSSQLLGNTQPLIVRRLVGQEAMCRLFHFDVEAVSLDPALDLEAIMKAPATIAIRQRVKLAGGGSGTRLIQVHGIVAHAEQTDLDGTLAVYHIEVVPRAWALTRMIRSRVFVDLDVVQLAARILRDIGLTEGDEVEFRIAGDYPQREYVVQYEESDFDFLNRWFEHEGLCWFFEHAENGERLVITDDPTGYTSIPNNETIRYNAQAGGAGRGDVPDDSETDSGEYFVEEFVSSFRRGHHSLPGVVRLKDYNWRNPGDRLLCESPVGGVTAVGEVQEYNNDYRSQADGNRLAAVRAGEYHCREVEFAGASDCRAFQPGARFTLSEHFRADFNTEFVVTAVEHEVLQTVVSGTGMVSEATYANRFRAIPADRAYRPERNTAWPAIHGIIHGHIAGHGAGRADMDADGAYLVKMPFDQANIAGAKEDDDGKDASEGNGKDAKPTRVSRRVRMAQPYAGAGFGMQFPLRPGTEVLIAHVDGDPDRPLIVGAVPNRANPAVIRGYDNASNIIRSASGQLLRMNDGPGHQGLLIGNRGSSIQLHDESGNNGLIIQTGAETIGLAGTKRKQRTQGPGGSGGAGGSAARRLDPATVGGVTSPPVTAGAGSLDSLSPRAGLFSGPLTQLHLQQVAGATAVTGGAPAGTALDDDAGAGGGSLGEFDDQTATVANLNAWRTSLVAEAGWFRGIDDPGGDNDITISDYARDFHDDLADSKYNNDDDYDLDDKEYEQRTAGSTVANTWWTDSTGKLIVIDGVLLPYDNLTSVQKNLDDSIDLDTGSSHTVTSAQDGKWFLSHTVGGADRFVTYSDGTPVTYDTDPDPQKQEADFWWLTSAGADVKVDGVVQVSKELRVEKVTQGTGTPPAPADYWALQMKSGGNWVNVQDAAGADVTYATNPGPLQKQIGWWEDKDGTPIKVDGMFIRGHDWPTTLRVEHVTSGGSGYTPGFGTTTSTGAWYLQRADATAPGGWANVVDAGGQVVKWDEDPEPVLYTPVTSDSPQRAQMVFHGRLAKIAPGMLPGMDKESGQGAAANEALAVELERFETMAADSGPFPGEMTAEEIREASNSFKGAEGNSYKITVGNTLSVTEGFSGSFKFGNSKSISFARDTQSYSNVTHANSIKFGHHHKSVSNVDHVKSVSNSVTKRSATNIGFVASETSQGVVINSKHVGVDIGNNWFGIKVANTDGILQVKGSLIPFTLDMATGLSLTIKAGAALNIFKNAKYDIDFGSTSKGVKYSNKKWVDINNSKGLVVEDKSAGKVTTTCSGDHVIESMGKIDHDGMELDLHALGQAKLRGVGSVEVSSLGNIKLDAPTCTINGMVSLGSPGGAGGAPDVPNLATLLTILSAVSGFTW